MELISLLTICAEKNIQLSLDQDQLKVSAPKDGLTPDIVAQLRDCKAQIIEHLKKAPAATNSRHNAIDIVDRSQPIPASYGQEQLWFIHNIADIGDSYHFARVINCKGVINTAALTQAFNTIIERHEALRTVFFQIDGSLYQRPLELAQLEIPTIDLRNHSSESRRAMADQITQAFLLKPFDFSKDLMIRVQLLQLADDSHDIIIVLQHIATDGWSLGILIKELQQLYNFYVGGENPDLPAPSVQYADYSAWQRQRANEKSAHESLAYWQTQLTGAPEIHTLTTDHARPAQLRYAGANLIRTVNNETLASLKLLARDSGVTLFMLLESIFALLIFRYSQSRDIVIGTPAANRDNTAIENLIGYFVNMIALRHQPDPAQCFSEFLETNKKMLVAAFSHQHVPFETIVRSTQKQRSLSHNPLIQIGFSFQNNEIPELQLRGLECVISEPHRAVAQLDVNLDIAETPQGLMINWCYSTDLFEQTSIERMALHFEALISRLLVAPNSSLRDLDFFSAQEQQQFLTQWNSTYEPYPQNKCVHEFFEAQAERHPDHIALIFQDTQLSYGELNARANQLAHFLVAQRDIKPDSLVGLCVERSPDMLVAILGILKAGGAYVPMDPAYPPARLSYMLRDANLKTVITQSDLADIIALEQQQAVLLDTPAIQRQLDTYSTANLSTGSLGLSTNCLAYVLYTSGSTGNPKGVMVEHKNVANFLYTMAQAPGIDAADRLLAITSTSFDIHGLELFLPLFAGAKIILATRSDALDPECLIKLIDTHRVSILQATPATWKMLVDAQWAPLNPIKILCGGEALSHSLAEELLRRPQLQLWNMYGPTETTIWSCVKRIQPTDARILMGAPIGNTQVYVVAEADKLVPIGAPGELLIGGDGVTRGYLNRPDLTAEKFIDNPFLGKLAPGASAKVYRTGDLVRWLANGELEYISRMDHQVKIRGFRIELGEIENALLQQDAIKDAVVLAKDSTNGDKYLAAYLVPANEQCLPGASHSNTNSNSAQQAWIQALRAALSTSLPDYMVPALYIFLDALPLTPNGKVDRKALPEPDLSNDSRPYSAPTTAAEKRLCAIWAEVLNSEKIGIDDNFFLSGGDSLKAVRLVGKARAAGFDHNLKQLYTMNIQELATLWREPVVATGGRDLVVGALPLSSAQMWFFSTLKINPGKGDISSLFRFTDLNIDSLHHALRLAVYCHDNLRATFHTQSNGDVIQQLLPPHEAIPSIEQYDISALDEVEQSQYINAMFTEDVARGIDLASAPLLRIKTFYLGQQQSAVRLSIHHVIVDEFSLSILLDDIFNFYHAAITKTDYRSPAPSISLVDWSHKLRARSNSMEQQQEAAYWHALPWTALQRFPTSQPETADNTRLAGFVQRKYRLPKLATEALLAFAQRENIPVINIVIAAITQTLGEYNQAKAQLVKVIDSARDMEASVDLSRTAGWLAISRILLLTTDEGDFDQHSVRKLHQQIADVPNKGLGFELLQRYSNDKNIRARFDNYPKPEILINYRGQVDTESVSGDLLIDSFNHLRETLPQFDLQNSSDEKFVFVAAIADAQLNITWRYNAQLIEHELMAALAVRILDKLSQLTAMNGLQDSHRPQLDLLV